MAQQHFPAMLLAIAGCSIAWPVSAQTPEYRDDRFRFEYPSNWQVRQGSPIPGVVHLTMTPIGALMPRIVFMYRRMDPSTRCYWLHPNYMEEFIKGDTAMAWRQIGNNVSESLKSGEAYTTTFIRQQGRSAVNVATTVCSAGDTALVVYEAEGGLGVDRSVRDNLLRSLEFGDGSLAGVWYGEGSVLTLDASGRLGLSSAWSRFGADARRGTWSQQGRHLRLNWRTDSVRPAETVTCEIESHSGGQLKVRCSDVPGVVKYVRH